MQNRSVAEPEIEQTKFEFRVLLYLHFPLSVHFLSRLLMWITGDNVWGLFLIWAEVLLQAETWYTQPVQPEQLRLIIGFLQRKIWLTDTWKVRISIHGLAVL